MIPSTALHSRMRAEAATFERCEADLRRRCDARNVHAVRVAARRLRALLWSMKPWIRRDPYRLCAKRLKSISRELGPLRDLDVLGHMLLTQIAGEVKLSRARRCGLETAIRRQRVKMRRKLRAAIHAARYVQQCRQLRDLLMDRALFRRALSPDPAAWRKRILRGVEDFDGKSQRVAVKDLHRIRVLAKRCRYSLEALGPDVPRKAYRRMKSLQTSLGSYCDVRLAVLWLESGGSMQDEVLRKRLLRAARTLERQRADAALRALRKRAR